ncbi:TetR/AcrR family transcriptional regulator [Phytoactinopolyspora mesophila]|uniref:TetR family transcriptional regulator n=1 Tax=Phytoactinopolyspora mesophila TaxID=2650750 RepID=A0A7K3M4L9_9ACTN|nr:TetR/AcrR family transcriptional regulator [Phytoactinopolyspora mesophila]NDL58261.1 TetR family transcriptional regulator [Phytoactinopolyspora mesophila]
MAERGRPRAFDRQAALRGAMELFWEYGYEGTSIKDLTHVMGINPPSLYAAFESKEVLFREAIALYASTDGAVTDRALREEPTARGAIEAMLRGNAGLYARPGRSGGCMFVLAATNCNARSEEIREFLAAERRKTVMAVEDRLERAISEGELPPGTDTAGVAGFYGGVLHGISIEARDGVPRARLESIVDSAMAAWSVLTGTRQLAGGGA